MPRTSAQDAVLAELWRLRKRVGAVTVDALASEAPTITRLLGAGDPYLAYTRLQQHLIEEAHDRTIKAAAASLGFSSEHATHLDRLVELAGTVHVGDRQARRLSDEGLQALAILITSNWLVEAIPELTTALLAESDGWQVAVAATWPPSIQMRQPDATLHVGERQHRMDLDLQAAQDGERCRLVPTGMIQIARTDERTSLSVVWRGEVWPKFTCTLAGAHEGIIVEMLGNRLMMRLVHA